ncbi:lysophospholipid acyltransferase family protein [Aestuariibius sp. HNIBRBA575]|uniref:lysophospholipid acyltransferase family protein n=1 Tax=Aestuariibius sp. HNIBRBA575 TaxID=3233343 RepID=UPI0034A102A1
MKYAIQWLRSLIFVGQMYFVLAVVGIVFFPWALVSRHGAFAAAHFYCAWVMWTARWMVGLKTEVRGTPPTDECMIAAKHQSFLDIIMIFHAVPRGKFIMKRSLLWTPVIGQYGLRMGCVPVNRGKRAQAIKKMVADVNAGTAHPGQLIIYSQGTRVAPGVKRPYKVGTGVLYEQLQQDCVPVACNVGVFWPRTGIYRKPGTAVVEFLPRVPAGQEHRQMLKSLEKLVEAKSNTLMREAGFTDIEE